MRFTTMNWEFLMIVLGSWGATAPGAAIPPEYRDM
jgi:hypothetical protein